MTLAISVVLLISLVVMLALGIAALRSKSTEQAAIRHGLAHGLGFFILFLALRYAVPMFTQLFEEYEVDLTVGSVFVMGLGFRLESIAPTVFLVLAVAYVVDGVAFWLLYERLQTRRLAKIFSSLVSGLLAIALAVVLVMMVRPSIELWKSGLF